MATTVTTRFSQSGSEQAVNLMTIDWESAADGTVTQALGNIHGVLLCVDFVPDGGGTQPSNLYDATITNDVSGIDVLSGRGANLSNAAASSICPGVALNDGTTTSVVPRATSGAHTLNITNAGDSKGGKVLIHFR